MLAAGLLLAGCGSVAPTATEIPVAPSSTLAAPTAGTTPETTPAPVPPASPAAPIPEPGSTPTAAGASTPERVTLPWPAATPAEIRALQASVDGGAEPWLLDPTEVAMSYVTAAHGWTQAQAKSRPGGRTVDVQEGRQKLQLTMIQPSRAGTGGIWVVTAETPSG